MPDTYDHIVIGVGGMGSATVCHLAQRGRRVLGLEQFDVPHAYGSSHGTARIIRMAYNEHPDYVPLLRRAYELWRGLETGFGRQLLYVTGGLDIGPPDGQIVSGSLNACKLHDLDHEVLSAADVAQRYPGIAPLPDFAAVYQPDGGFVLSEQAIIAHVAAAHAAGGEVRAREPVLEWSAHPGGDGVTVRTSRGVYEAGSLVITAGAWSNKIITGLGTNARPQRQVLGFFQPLTTDHYRLGNFPAFILDAEEGEYYGHAEFGVPGFKIGRFYHREQWTDPDAQQRDIEDADEEILRRAVRRYFPAADGPTMALVPCMFTMAPDRHFIIDRLRDAPQVAIGAGFSGHGYKFCSVIGEVMADLAVDRATRHDIAMFAITRLT